MESSALQSLVEETTGLVRQVSDDGSDCQPVAVAYSMEIDGSDAASSKLGLGSIAALTSSHQGGPTVVVVPIQEVER